jgi:hypothetical protein
MGKSGEDRPRRPPVLYDPLQVTESEMRRIADGLERLEVSARQAYR